MSDQNQYQDYGDYDEYGYDENNYDDGNNIQQQQEDYQTKVQLEYFQAEEMLRKNNMKQCLQSLEKLYEISQQHNLRNWKPKILNLQLQIYSKQQHNNQQQITNILTVLHKISELNSKQKYTQSSIKSIIMTIKGINDREVFNKVKEDVYKFIQGLDDMNQVRSWLMLVERMVDQKNYHQGHNLVQRVNAIRKKLLSANNSNTSSNITTNAPNTAIPSSLLIQLYSHQITLSKHSHNTQSQSLTSLINKIHLTLPQLQTQSYLSDGHISIIKQSIAQIKYEQQNYIESSKLLCQSFQQQMKYGKDNKKKKYLLKVNVLVALLIADKQLYMKDKHNALYHQSAASFKSQNDIQSLYGLVEAFNNGDYVQFEEQLKNVNLQQQLSQQNNPAFYKIVQKVITLIKSNKLIQIIKPYTNVKFSYLSRRLNSNIKKIEQIVYELIMDDKINGRIKREQQESYLVKNQDHDQYLKAQLENVQQLAKRYL